jgi:hypothetical protein
LNTAVRIDSEKQTLILAGESVPRRDLAQKLPSDLTVVASSADNTFLLSSSSTIVRSAALTFGGFSLSAANAYARTQEISALSARMPIIDTYA